MGTTEAIAGHTAWPNAPRMLFVAALIPGLYQLFHPVGYGFGHGFEMVAIAKSLAEHGTFGNPFEPVMTGPTAVVPPLYPLFLAALIKVLRLSSLVAFTATLANIVINALIAAWMPRLSTVFYGDALPGLFAGALWIFAARLMPQWDMSYTLAGLVLFCFLTASTIRGERLAYAAVTAGLLGGVLSLLNPAALLVCFSWAAFLLLSRRLPLAHALRYGAILVFTVALCNLPWVARNYFIWHAFVLRTNFGMTLYASNNSCAQSSLFKDGRDGCYQSNHPVASPAEARLLQTLGEVRYDRRRTADALYWIRGNPRRFQQITGRRVVEFWFPDPEGVPYTVYGIWAITILSLPGLLIMTRRRESVSLFVAFVWLIYPLLYYVVVSSDRYRYPILWTSLMPAGYGLTALLPKGLAARLKTG